MPPTTRTQPARTNTRPRSPGPATGNRLSHSNTTHTLQGSRDRLPPLALALQYDERTYDSKIEAVEPSLENVSEFLQRSVKRAHFEAATVVGIVIIFKRVFAACSVRVFTWRILLILSILLAQNIIDDKSLGTNQFKELFAYATKNMISVVLPTPIVIKMELYLLDVLEYRVNITCTEHSTCARELRGNIITM